MPRFSANFRRAASFPVNGLAANSGGLTLQAFQALQEGLQRLDIEAGRQRLKARLGQRPQDFCLRMMRTSP